LISTSWPPLCRPVRRSTEVTIALDCRIERTKLHATRKPSRQAAICVRVVQNRGRSLWGVVCGRCDHCFASITSGELAMVSDVPVLEGRCDFQRVQGIRAVVDGKLRATKARPSLSEKPDLSAQMGIGIRLEFGVTEQHQTAATSARDCEAAHVLMCLSEEAIVSAKATSFSSCSSSLPSSPWCPPQSQSCLMQVDFGKH
jgi:hypothetical protein